ncbi:type 1 glutamine amidotransferase [Sunxiuqinia sp. A32]|uniref:type 1 glutamine amidotransferase n=1 Tax=Sunxiuqinia sp. A32 TaxID=3461496 RepID=UPI004045FECF
MLKILIINSAEPEIFEFAVNIEKLIPSHLATCQIINYREAIAVNVDSYDGIFISGSPQGDDIVEHHQPYFLWIKDSKKPILGICAGHHITGYLYGAEYLRSVEPESGDVLIEVLKDDPLFIDLPHSFLVRQMHNDSVPLPKGFIHLAQSKVCFNQAMKHAEKPLYTLQFHPEYLNPEIIHNFTSICIKYRML